MRKREFMLASMAAAGAAAVPSVAMGASPLSPDIWAEFLDRLKGIQERAGIGALDDDLQVRFYEHCAQMLAFGWFNAFAATPQKPYFVPIQNFMLTTAAPNPDTQYFTAPLEKGAAFRISGRRGNCDFVDAQWGAGRPGMPGSRMGRIDIDELNPGPNGEFEFFLGGAENGPNWRALLPDAESLTFRCIAKDWKGAVGPALAIEKLSSTGSALAPAPASLSQRLDDFVAIVDYWTRLFAVNIPGNWPKEEIKQWVLDDIGAMQGQYYYRGAFELSDDDCLVMQSEVPAQSRYWNVQLTDRLLMTVDYAAHQCSLNDHQAHIDTDGRFRAVISLKDPGVPNWLDPGGNRSGLILGRWLDADRNYIPTLRRMKLSQLRDAFPQSTPSVTAEEREIRARERNINAQMRGRW